MNRKKVKYFIFLGIFCFSFALRVSAIEGNLSFNRALGVGMSGSDVFYLQKILNIDPETKILEGAGSKGFETDYFGAKTKDAVVRFQNKYASEILFPLGLSNGTGYVGNLTLKKLASLISAENPGVLVPKAQNFVAPNALLPSFSLNSTEISEGQEVLISGNFLARDVLGVYAARNLESGAGKLEKIQEFEVKDGSIEFKFSIPFSESLSEDFDSYRKISEEVYEKIWDALSLKFLGTKDEFLVPIFIYVETKSGMSVPIEAKIKFER